MSKVYVHADAQGRVIAINSDAFLPDATDWVQIDEGDGDRYHHAQGNYLHDGLTTPEGIYKYKLDGGALAERTPEEIQADIDVLPPPPPSTQEQIDKQERRFEALSPIIGDLLTGREADVVIRLQEFLPAWTPGKWDTDQSCVEDGYPYRTIAPGHDSTAHPDWMPSTQRALFAPWHGMTEDTALPWFPPLEAESTYKPGEYMIWTDGRICRAVRQTNFSPAEYPGDWEVQGDDGLYHPFG